MDMLSLFGTIGGLCILLAFFQTSRGRWKGTSWKFQAVNLAGASILGVYSWILHAHALVGLNVVWILVASVGLYRCLVPQKRRKS